MVINMPEKRKLLSKLLADFAKIVFAGAVMQPIIVGGEEVTRSVLVGIIFIAICLALALELVEEN